MGKGKAKKTKETKSSEPTATLYYGKDSFKLPNGDTYEGDYCAHRIGLIWREGHGVYKSRDGQTYEGEWKDDKLVENNELTIKYPNGVEYHGCLSKNKYKGAGTYTLECKMDLSCNFEENKPVGTVVLIDYEGKLWVGEAKEGKAILFPENAFYLNLSEENGKGFLLEEETSSPRSIEEETSSSKSIVAETSSPKSIEEEEEKKANPDLTDREWEKLVFKRSSKTENDVNFNDSRWVKKFERFNARKAEVLVKLEEGENLTDEEQLWMDKFETHQAKRKEKEEQDVLLKKKASEDAMKLIERFRSPEFNESCPGVSVIYASPLFKEQEDAEAKTACQESDDEGMFEDVAIPEEDAEDQDGSNVTIVSYFGLESRGPFKSNRFDNLIKLEEYVKKLEASKSKLHFTEERNKRRAEVGKKLAQMRGENTKLSTGEEEQNYPTTTRVSEANRVQNDEELKRKSKRSSEVSKVKAKASTTNKIAIDEKTALQERIKKYVEEHFEAKEKLRREEKPDAVLPKRLPHTHNVAVCTESSDEIWQQFNDSVKT